MLNTKKQSQFNNDFQPQIGYGLHINKNPHHGENLSWLPLRGQILPEPLILFFGKIVLESVSLSSVQQRSERKGKREKIDV